jgi:hypothetical protein
MLGSRRAVVVVAAVALLAVGGSWLPASAAADLDAAAFSVVDFNDGVLYSVGGSGCGGAVHVEVSVGGRTVAGPLSTPARGWDGCRGMARVPTFDAVSATGWKQGDPIDILLVGLGSRIPLRYARIEVDWGREDAETGTDPDTRPEDKVLPMASGASVDLGQANLAGVDAVAIRACIPRVEPTSAFSDDGSAGALFGTDLDPVVVSIHQESPDGPELLHPVDISSTPASENRMSTAGYGGTCWRLATVPLTGQALDGAPRLFLHADVAAPGMLVVNSVDVVGAGSVPNWVTPDPAGMRTIFDGTSFDGWDQTGCELRDGAAVPARGGDRASFYSCSMNYDQASSNQVIRLELRSRDFFDNGGIFIPNEIQLRRVGEFGPGGYFGAYAARFNKLRSDAWSQMEIVQLGGRYVVRVNGRTVTDHDAGTAPAPYRLRIGTQPTYSQHYGSSSGHGYEVPDVNSPDEWGGFKFRNIRVYTCAGLDDPLCVALANANPGQTPRR